MWRTADEGRPSRAPGRGFKKSASRLTFPLDLAGSRKGGADEGVCGFFCSAPVFDGRISKPRFDLRQRSTGRLFADSHQLMHLLEGVIGEGTDLRFDHQVSA